MIEASAPAHDEGMAPDVSPPPPEAAPCPAAATLPARRERLQALVAAHFGFIWRLVRRHGLPAPDADDVAQQVFVVATERLADIAPGRERSFLFGTALRAIATRRRAGARERPDDAVDPSDPVPAADELTSQKRLREMLDAILDKLDDDARVVFVLVEIEGLSNPEVSELLKVPAGTVASRLRRARAAFDAEVKRIEARLAFQPGGRP